MGEQLGFIGLGNMGSRLALNLSADHGGITVWDRKPAIARERSPKGATVVDSIEGLVQKCDVIFISISDDSAAEEVIRQVTEQSLKGKVIIDFSTLTPELSAHLADRVNEKGGKMLDAAISGSTPAVEARSVIILVGGDQKVFEAHKKYLGPLGASTFYMGQNGDGLVMKLCINALLGIGAQAIAEALVLGQKSGLDKAKIIEVLSATAVVSPSQKAKLRLAKDDSYDSVTFALSLMYKDFGLIINQAQKVNALMPATAASRQIAASGVSAGREVDFAAVIKVLEEMASVDG